MTKAAKYYGKVLSDFWRLQETAEYLDAMVVTTGIPLEILKQARCGGKGADVGTWAHPKLAVFFARWLDVRFAVWCDLMVDEILRGRVEVQPVAAPLTPDRTVEDIVKALLPEVRRGVSFIPREAPQGRALPNRGGKPPP